MLVVVVLFRLFFFFWVRLFHVGNNNNSKQARTYLPSVPQNKSELIICFPLNTHVLLFPVNYQYSNPVNHGKFSVFAIPKMHSVNALGPDVPVRKSAVLLVAFVFCF